MKYEYGKIISKCVQFYAARRENIEETSISSFEDISISRSSDEATISFLVVDRSIIAIYDYSNDILLFAERFTERFLSLTEKECLQGMHIMSIYLEKIINATKTVIFRGYTALYFL